MSDAPPPSTLREIRREIRAHLAAPLVLATLAAVSLALGLSGPFDTHGAMRFGPRLAYWSAVVFGTYATGTAVTVAVSRVGPARPFPVQLGVQIAVTGLAVGIVLTGLQALAFGRLPADTTGWARIFGTAWVISALVLGLGALAEARRVPDASHPAAPELMDRLPIDRRGRLLALSVQDHYVEVRTTAGRALVLMRLSDAMREARPVRGLQVHRSHWVAVDAVRSARRTGETGILTLIDGTEIPVSRRHMPDLREAGLLPAARRAVP